VGSLLDSTAVIAAERARQTAQQFMLSINRKIGDQPIVLSAVGYTELLNGLYREHDLLRRQRRDEFFTYLLRLVPVMPYTLEVAELAGRLGGEAMASGRTIPFVDLMIGATALSLNFSVLTSNERHFRLIPGLAVIPF
jgi:tRNA(fMet)-specific endonuclease VapC